MSTLLETFLRVVLPTSILSVEHHLALKSIRIHQVARWTSIFGVHEVVFYKEPSTDREEFNEHKKLIENHWRYFFTPPYLRRKLIPINPLLKYVGMLPPIRLEVFNVSKKPRNNEIRVGYIYRDSNRKLRALIGDDAVYSVVNQCEKTGLTPLRVRDVERRIVECIETPLYTGPRLLFTGSLREAVDNYRAISKFVIATDRNGLYPGKELIEAMRGSDVTLLFGGPRFDLFEISSQEGFELGDYVDYVWNTIPRQKVVSVRTEEALIITLGIINVFLRGL
ncbi:MAG: putative RNA uridine N3 methyltransferase [Desulfurococcaceae archaeon]